uniref:Secreted protein n=1 Tax=Chrysotila carterae TaxID=13221 RepID=A0A7S4BGW8_CHRCT
MPPPPPTLISVPALISTLVCAVMHLRQTRDVYAGRGIRDRKRQRKRQLNPFSGRGANSAAGSGRERVELHPDSSNSGNGDQAKWLVHRKAHTLRGQQLRMQ